MDGFPAQLSHKLYPFNGNPSEEVAQIIFANPRLKHLHLAQMRLRPGFRHDRYDETRINALEVLGPRVSGLSSLRSPALTGELKFTNSAWQSWNHILRRLQSLCVIGTSLIHQMAARLQGQLSNLQTLRLQDDCNGTIADRASESAFIMGFLSGTNLTHLSLIGFRPQILFDVFQTCGARLRTVHCQWPRLWRPRRPNELWKLTASNVQLLGAA